MKSRILSLLFLVFIAFADVSANVRIYETIITVDADGTIGQQVGYTTIPEFGYISMKGLNGKSLVRDGNTIYQIFYNMSGVYLRKTYDGIHWSIPIQVNDSAAYAYGDVNPCDLGFADDHGVRKLVVAWVKRSDSTYTLFSATSIDSGKTFSSARIHHSSSKTQCYYVSMASDVNGGLYLLWSDLSAPDADMTTIWMTRTNDGAFNWTTPTSTIYAATSVNNHLGYVDGASCDGSSITVFSPGDQLNFYRFTSDGMKTDHVRPFSLQQGERMRYSRIIRDGECLLHAFFTTREYQYFYIYHSSSTDDGRTWHDSTRIAAFDADPLLYTENGRVSIAFAPGGKIYAVYGAGIKLYMVISNDKGKTWQPSREIITKGSNQTPSLAYIGSNGSKDSLLIVWEDYRELSAVHPPAISSSFDMLVFPNPAHKEMTISATMNRGCSLSIDIIDPLGRIVKSIQEKCSSGKNEFQLNIEGLAAGMYFVSALTNQGERATQRIIIHP